MKLEALGQRYLRQGMSCQCHDISPAVCRGRRRNNVVVAMAMPAGVCRALRHRSAQSVDNTFAISQ